jgi:DNA-directed RNA polymerase I, II, and III subunit RPABC2
MEESKEINELDEENEQVVIEDDDEDTEIDDDDEDVDEDTEAGEDDEEEEEDENIKPTGINIDIMGYEDDEDDNDYYEDNNPEDEIDYLNKFDDDLKVNYVEQYHPEEISINYDEVRSLSSVTRDSEGIIVDELHKTLPILTKYEYTRILGVRAKQINEGASPFVKVDKEVLDGYLIAQIEIKQKKLPFILKRPIPNGGMEYWKIGDLEILN